MKRSLPILVALAICAPAASRPQSAASETTARAVTFYSEGIACRGRLYLPPGYDPGGSVPAVVLAHGWTGTMASRDHALERYAERFARRGLVALAIDYRGWGASDGYLRLAEPFRSDDRLRLTEVTARVTTKRTRLLPEHQIEDIRNAISYLQGEPGVDAEHIGLWGSSFSGGHVVSIAARDARVKAGVAQVPAIAGNGVEEMAFEPTPEMLEDAIQRARTGTGETFESGFSRPVEIDVESRHAAAEYRPFHDLDELPEGFPILFLTAERDELVDNRRNAVAAAEVLGAGAELIEIPAISHFEIYEGEAFETSAEAAADWFVEHLMQSVTADQ